MIIEFNNFLNENSKIGYTFNIFDIIKKYNNREDFYREFSRLIEDRIIKLSFPFDPKRLDHTIYVKKFRMINSILCSFEDMIKMKGLHIGTLETENNKMLIQNNNQITILDEPKIVISSEDPYGEEDWNDDKKVKPDINWDRIFRDEKGRNSRLEWKNGTIL